LKTAEVAGFEYFITMQAGEASVTNPSAGVVAESLLYGFARNYEYLTDSSLVDSAAGVRVLLPNEVALVGCTLAAIHAAFKSVPDGLLAHYFTTCPTSVALLVMGMSPNGKWQPLATRMSMSPILVAQHAGEGTYTCSSDKLHYAVVYRYTVVRTARTAACTAHR
jgi:hypothetical protein